MDTIIRRCKEDFRVIERVPATDHLHAGVDVAISKHTKGLFLAQCHGYIAIPKEQAIFLVKHLEKLIEQI